MFNNLIESSAHTREFKRRGSFVLFTTATYMLLFIVAGVISIYAYDARLEEPSNIIVTMLPPTDVAAAPTTASRDVRSRSNSDRPTVAVRQIAMARMDRPDLVPEKTSATPNEHLPIPRSGDYTIGRFDSDPVVPTGTGVNRGSDSDSGVGPSARAIDVGTPPPAQPPVERTVPRVISKGAITGLALVLPKPAYPPIAKQAHASGPVNVQVLVDENGKVISAKAVKGHPMLLAAAQQAAMAARFTPTKLGDQAVKVSGMITYNFVLQ